MPGGDVRIRLAFPGTAMFSHDCLPNVVRHIDRHENGFEIQCYAARSIKKGEKLSNTYVDLFLPGLIRRDILKQVKSYNFNLALVFSIGEFPREGCKIRKVFGYKSIY